MLNPLHRATRLQCLQSSCFRTSPKDYDDERSRLVNFVLTLNTAYVFFQCNYCKVVFDTASTLVAHKQYKHGGQVVGIGNNANHQTGCESIK